MRSLKNMAMLTLGNTISSVSTGAGELGKKTPMRARNVLASRISSKSTNERIELSANHNGKLLVDSQKLTTSDIR